MLAQLNGNLTRAEQLYLENGEADKAVDMYINLNKWEDAIRITQRMVSTTFDQSISYELWISTETFNLSFQFGDYVSILRCLVIHFMSFFMISKSKNKSSLRPWT